MIFSLHSLVSNYKWAPSSGTLPVLLPADWRSLMWTTKLLTQTQREVHQWRWKHSLQWAHWQLTIFSLMDSEIFNSTVTKFTVTKVNSQKLISTGVDNSRRTWFFDVTVSSCPAFLSACQRWILDNSTAGFEHDTCSVDTCPPSEDFAIAFGWPCVTGDPAFAVRTCYRPYRRLYSSTGSFRNRDIGVAQNVCNFVRNIQLLYSVPPFRRESYIY